ncbi:hypothetical protein E4T42_08508 [Aureobasidium subglaciale]|nr:hypothetical protein E4T38_09215 [Aureobasidium subglaciale]KAI5214215.1 hypothetical protein E4T40_09129 [Aureobasidium subglaciale]KAI5216733.1 hypothetical protein E4T41_09130 [Aureobasidium subglaciale]KAI5239972.1 hypothetical protein E4T42_08508 [Aureobasidium subglaciale]KAI5254492.1 hypothetical protein E4T46_09122 [Aureobasidium subglaciale]
MVSKKDMRRGDLIVPYAEPADAKSEADVSSEVRFLWLLMIGWVAVIFAVQNWLSETPESTKNQSTPGYMTVGMAPVAYLPLFMPPIAAPGMGSGTEAPAAAAVPTP